MSDEDLGQRMVIIHAFTVKRLNIKCVCLMLYRNKAVADYLKSSGYHNAFQEFQKEAELVGILLIVTVTLNFLWIIS